MHFDIARHQFENTDQTPDQLAIVGQDGEYTWQELKDKSDYFKTAFEQAGIPPGHPVIIYGHKEKDFIAAITAAIRLELPYIPIDIVVPVERIQKIKSITGASVLVKVGSHDPNVEFPVVIDGQRTRQTSFDFVNGELYHREDPIVYIIFTSGSTGEPKGVQITREAVESHLDWVARDFGYQVREVFVNQAPFSFDLSVYELMAFLQFGATIILNDQLKAADPQLFLSQLKKYNGSIWVSTPSFAYKFLGVSEFNSSHLPSVSAFLFCGETLPARTAKVLLERFPMARVLNTYGPTEATVATTYVDLTKEMLGQYDPLPVGYPKYTSEIWIDKNDNEKDGEIVIVGKHVSIGYFKMPELNSEKFIIRNGERGFRTGDYGYIDNGMLFYSGRKDEQVKLHGFRIELGDINAQLLKLSEVTEAVTVPLRRNGEVKKIISFVILRPESGSIANVMDQVKQHLAKNLPEYMVPSNIIDLTEFPYSNNHKIDKNKLIEWHLQGKVK